jgi:hypothetical protein
MIEHADTLPRFDLHHLAEAVAEIVIDDLDYLYGQRMLNHRAQSKGPEGDAARAANSIAYLASRLLPEILRYQRGVILLRQQEACRDDHTIDDDVPW